VKRLLTIEDTFFIPGRGLVVVPGPLEEEFAGPGNVEVELRRPDGSVRQLLLTLAYHFQSPPSRERRWSCTLGAQSKAEVPIGTEVWIGDVR
jgi:hypothetical protein